MTQQSAINIFSSTTGNDHLKALSLTEYKEQI
jgi:hypothetical protein